MNCAILSLNDQRYQPLADLTWNNNKVKYAEKHGYSYACKTDDFLGIQIGFEKIWFMRDMLEAYPEIDWFWWTGCDSLITNMNIRIEDKIDPDYHLIIATDCNGINSDSFLLKNSVESKNYLDMIKSKYHQYINHYFYEQGVIIDTLDEYKDIIKIVPQRSINAYNTDLHPHQSKLDKLGTNGTWQYGDWLIHWPGTSLEHRIHLANFYMYHVIK
jgi:hypothetical protein